MPNPENFLIAQRQKAIRATHPPVKEMHRRFSLSFCGLLASFVLLSGGQAEIKYTVTAINGTEDTLRINREGEVLGDTVSGGIPHGYTYRAGVFRDLGTLSGYFSYPHGINNCGDVVGNYYPLDVEENPPPLGYLQPRNGKVRLLGVPNPTVAIGINDYGVVVGNTYLPGGNSVGFIYRDGHLSALGSFQGHPLFQGEGINNRNEILAWYNDDHPLLRAVVVSGGQIRDIGPVDATVTAVYINDSGAVLGNFRKTGSGQVNHLFVDNNGQFHDLGPENGRFWAAINERGKMVGWQLDPVKGTYFAIISERGQTEDLNGLIDPKLGIYLYQATGINDAGQISGTGIGSNGPMGVILEPVRNRRRCK